MDSILLQNAAAATNMENTRFIVLIGCIASYRRRREC